MSAHPRIVDLMVSVVNAELEVCAHLTRFCVNAGSRCPKHTNVPTCCTIDTGDPNCKHVCDDCFTNSFLMLSMVLKAAVDEKVLSSVKASTGPTVPKRHDATPKRPGPKK